MSIHGHLISRGKPESQPGPLDDFWYSAARSSGSTGGQRVTATTAERVAAVYACKTAIGESVAMLPACVFNEIDETRKKKDKDHPLFKLLRHSPNDAMDSFNFFESMQDGLLDYGNAYAYKVLTNSGRIDALIPLDPTRMTVKAEHSAAGLPSLRYLYREQGGRQIDYSSKDIFHLKYRSKDGLVGRSPVMVAAESFGFPLALLEHGNQVFANGAFLSGFLSSDFAFKDDETRDEFMASFRRYVGAGNSGKFALLEQGVKYEPHQMNARDAQFLELSEFSVVQVARIFRVPPVIIQAMDKGMSYASIEQLATFFVQYTIQPWITRWERAIKTQLLGGEREEDLFVRFNVSALIRGDLKTRTEALVQQLQYGLRTINEARNLLDENALDNEIGDEPLLSHNLKPASQAMEPDSGPEPANSPDSQKTEPPEGPQSDDLPPTSATASTQQTPDVRISYNYGTKLNTATALEDEKEKRFKPLFKGLLGRIIRKEVNAKKRAVKKPGFMKWAETFLSEQRDYMLDVLYPVMLAYGGTEQGLSRFIDEHLENRQADLIDNIENAWEQPVEDHTTNCTERLQYLLGEILF